MEQKEIRFIDIDYNELFRIPDGGIIKITFKDGSVTDRKCTYIDDYHTQIGYNTFHICEFAEVMERSGSTYEPTTDTLKTINIQFVDANYGEVDRDKFFKTDNGFTEVYYNPNANAGGQLVYNEISFDLIREAAQSGKRVQDFFSHLDSGCTQYLIDIDTPEFKGNLDSFMSRKADFENCTAKTMRELKKAAGIVPEKSHTDKDFER